MLRHKTVDIARWLVCGGAVLAAAVLVGGFLLLMNDTQTQMSEIKRDLGSLAYLLTDHADRTLGAVELVEAGLAQSLAGRTVESLSTIAVHEDLKVRIGTNPIINTLAIVGVDGRLVNFTRAWPVPDINLADRDYFRQLSALGAPEAVLSVPIRNRGNGDLVIYLARRLSRPDGSFGGILLGGLDVVALQRFYKRITPEEGRGVTLFRDDGKPLLQAIPADGALPPVWQPPENERSVNILTQFGIRTDAEGQDAFVAIRRSGQFPIVLQVSQAVGPAMKQWRGQAGWLAAVVLALEAGIAAVVLVGSKQLRAQEAMQGVRMEKDRIARAAAEAELVLAREREDAIHERHARDRRFGVALKNMSQGLCMFDRFGRILVLNDQFIRMMGLDVPYPGTGMRLRRLIGEAVARGGLSRADGHAIRLHLLQLRTSRRGGDAVTELSDGRFLAYAFRNMEDQGWVLTCEDITERRVAERRLVHMANHDPLTNLPNRVLLRQRIADALVRINRGDTVAVHCLNLDNFKATNDALGHRVGDALLQDVAARLTRLLREIDTVACTGGDGFVVVQASPTGSQDAAALATRLAEELALPFTIAGHPIVLTASIGITLAPGDGDDPDGLLRNADLALHRAKLDGGGCFRFFEAAMDAQMLRRRALEVDLRQALSRGQFRLFFQPLVSARTRTLVGFEALIRWFHPERGTVRPDEFIPLAEEIGVIHELGAWVVAEACREAVNWPAHVKVAVNLSSKQFNRSAAVVQSVRDALAQTGLAAQRLELEITETVVLHDTDDTLATLHLLKALGVRVSMDDFGTGYSSLGYLQKFPFDKLKIDQSFVRGLGTRQDCPAIIHAITGLCRSLGIDTTVEGVETEAQMEWLAGECCTEVQGYLFSKPRPAAELDELIARLG